MNKEKIAQNIYSYYKKMLELKRNVLLHEGSYITLDNFVEQISNQKNKSELNNTYKVLLLDDEIEELSVFAKKGVLMSNEFMTRSCRDYHIIRDLLQKNYEDMSEKIKTFYKNDKTCGIDSAFSLLASCNDNKIFIENYDLDKEIDFSFLNDNCIFIEDLYVTNLNKLKTYIDNNQYNEILNIVDIKLFNNIDINTPNIVLQFKKEELANIGICDFNEEQTNISQIIFKNNVSISDKTQFIPLKDALKKYNFDVKGYFTMESLKDVLLAMYKYDNLDEDKKQIFNDCVGYSVNKIMKYLRYDNIDLKDYNNIEYLMFVKKNGLFNEEQINKFKKYIETMIKIRVLSQNYYDLSNDYSIHGLYSSAAYYAGMNLVYFPRMFLKCGYDYVQDGQNIIKFDSLKKQK